MSARYTGRRTYGFGVSNGLWLRVRGELRCPCSRGGRFRDKSSWQETTDNGTCRHFLMLTMPRRATKGFDASAFYAELARIVNASGITWRQLARETGVAPSTFTRMARGRWPSGASLAALSAWANLNPA